MHLQTIIDFLSKVDELETAKIILTTFSKYAKNLQQYDELGMLFEKIKDYNDSIAMLENCLNIATSTEQLYSIRANLAKVYNHLNEPYKSLFYSNLNYELVKTDYDTQMEQSFSYYLIGDFNKSYQIQLDLLNINNISDEIHKKIRFNMGTFEIANGDFKSGMRNIVVGGKDIGIWKSINRFYDKWDGGVTDKTLLIFAEGGIGDEIINVRFMSVLKNKGIDAIWIGHNIELINLFQRNGFNACLESNIDPLQDYVYCESMMLSVLLNIEEFELYNGSYFKPSQQYIDKWKLLLPDKFITIKWSGNPFYDHDLHRTVPIDRLINTIREKTDIPIISLQLDDTAGIHNDYILYDIQSWEDTLAIQSLAKLNITSCTSTAHTASAMGVDCVVIPPICTYFPWLNLNENHTSKWYGKTTRIYPQTKWKDWSDPLEYIAQELLLLNKTEII